MKNRYVVRGRISEALIRHIVREFAKGESASAIARTTQLNRNTVNRYLAGIRQRIAEYCDGRTEHCRTALTDRVHVMAEPMASDGSGILHATRIRFDFHADGVRLEHAHVDQSNDPHCTEEHDGWRLSLWWQDRPIDVVARTLEARYLGDVHAVLHRLLYQLRQGAAPQNLHLLLKEVEFRHNNRSRDLAKLILDLLRLTPLTGSDAAPDPAPQP